jgi:hypothetical protein
MKSYPPRATPVVVLGYAKEPSATSAREKAIAYLSTVSRPRCNNDVRSAGNARVQHITLEILAEFLVSFCGDFSSIRGNKKAPRRGLGGFDEPRGLGHWFEDSDQRGNPAEPSLFRSDVGSELFFIEYEGPAVALGWFPSG